MPPSDTTALSEAAAIRRDPFYRLVKHLCAAEIAELENASWALGLVQLELGIYPDLDPAKRQACVGRVVEFFGLDEHAGGQTLQEAGTLERLAETAYGLFERGWHSVTFRTSGRTRHAEARHAARIDPD